MKKILMIAYAFPPANASGSARPFHFAKHLPEFGYQPIVLSRKGVGVGAEDAGPLAELPPECRVLRVKPWDGDDWPGFLRQVLFPFDGALRMFGLGVHEVSDRLEWGHRRLRLGLRDEVHWIWPAIVGGLRAFAEHEFDLIWATGDPWSSLRAGYWLSRLTGRPLIADQRDPWTYGALWHPFDEAQASWSRMWEKRVARHARRVVYTSPLTRDISSRRLGEYGSRHYVTITNGFACEPCIPKRAFPEEKCVFSHVGNFSHHRKPDVLLEGFALACRDERLAEDVALHLIGNVATHEKTILAAGLGDVVRCEGRVSHAESRQYMRGADVLVLLQTIEGPGRDVIAGKAFEYLAADKPILAVVPDDGGDAWLVRETEVGTVAGIDSAERVAKAIRVLWQAWKRGTSSSGDSVKRFARFSRRNLTGVLASLCDEVLNEVDGPPEGGHD